MIWALFGAVAIGLVGVIAALATSRWRYDPMSTAVTSVADPGLPEVVHPGDVDNVRFDTALRGYRIDQVDEVLDRLRDRLREQETMLRALRAEHPEPAGPAAVDPAPDEHAENAEWRPEPEQATVEDDRA